ncbi:MAG: ScyD/ScyE family protein [Bryobacteraceae bacterium]|nr:ScyD/ScyE family protein [Bryobacteraceae bacterium]
MSSLKLATLSLAAAALLLGQAEVIITGLQGPQKIILTPRGNFLVTETSTQTNSGRISFVSRAGVRRSLFEGMPSGTEVTGGGSGPTALALRDRTLYIAVGGGDIERRPPTGATIHNPAGASSPIFCSILEVRFSTDIDTITGTFRFTPAQQQSLADGESLNLEDGAGGRAQVSVLADFPDSVPEGTGYRFGNPWGLALTPDGSTLWVSDGSMNTLSRVNTATGRWQRQVRFPALPNIGPIGPPMIDAVPTSIRLYGDQILVSFLTGVPFSSGYARVLAVNPETKVMEPFIFNLTSAVDVLWRDRPGQRPQFFALEFSVAQLATPAGPGRLLRYDSPAPQVVLNDLRAPVSLAFDPATEELFILELSGRILKVSVR